MRYKTIHILTPLLLFGCNSLNDEEALFNADVNSKQIVNDWDKHQFYDDLEFTTLDSLGKVIELSDSIVAYNWNGNDGNPANVYHHIVDAYGKFDDRIGKNILINNSQKLLLKELLTDATNYEGSNAMCFIPHIAFVYYNKSKIIGQSNICFMCSGVKSVPKSTMALSKKGNTRIKQFCKAIGLDIMDNESQLTH